MLPAGAWPVESGQTSGLVLDGGPKSRTNFAAGAEWTWVGGRSSGRRQ